MAKAAAKVKARTQADRLGQGGIEAKRVYDIVLMDPDDLHLEKRPGHALFDPRVNDPVEVDDPDYQSILEDGVHTPIHAREDGERDGKPIVAVVNGRRRVKMLRHINKHHPLPTGPRRLQVKLVKGSIGVMVLLSLSSNGGKPETPYSRAVKIGMAEKNGMSLEDIARACGWSTVAHVQAHMPILNFIPEVQQAFHGPDALPLAAVKKFAKVPSEEQAAALAVVRDGGAKKTREVEAAVKAAQNGSAYVAPEKVARKWGRERMEKLAEVLDALGTLATELDAGMAPVPAGSAELAVAQAILRLLLGDEDAIAGQPILRAAVEKMNAPVQSAA